LVNLGLMFVISLSLLVLDLAVFVF
jgi:hypothetical protein